MKYYEREPLRFACTGCGKCCTGLGNYYIEVTRKEQRRIQRHLAITWRWFRRRYVGRFDENIDSLRTQSGGRCVFLGTDMRCRIYPVRPAQCRNYPFWPELVHRVEDWRAEARRCEGIGRGPIIPVARIVKILKDQPAS
jgi:hypothetical protein